MKLRGLNHISVVFCIIFTVVAFIFVAEFGPAIELEKDMAHYFLKIVSSLFLIILAMIGASHIAVK